MVIKMRIAGPMWKFAGLVSALMLNGCAAAGLTLAGAGAGTAAGAGVEHTLTGITYKTFTEPLEKVRDATVDSLARMDMNIVEDGATPDGWAFKALAADRTIDIELQKLTETTTRMGSGAFASTSIFVVSPSMRFLEKL